MKTKTMNYYKEVAVTERLPEDGKEVFMIGFDRLDKGFIVKHLDDKGRYYIQFRTKEFYLVTSFIETHEELESIFWLEPFDLMELIKEKMEEAFNAGAASITYPVSSPSKELYFKHLKIDINDV